MKTRLFAILLAGTIGVGAQAQEATNFTAFKNVGVGLEVGLMGFGAQVSLPLISDHLIFTAGYNFFAFGNDIYKTDYSISANNVNDGIGQINDYVERHNAKPGASHIDKVNTLPSDIKIDAGFKLGSNVKLLLEYYPSKMSGFHITGGVMIGNSDFVEISGSADDNVQKLYKNALEVQTQLQNEGEISKKDDFVHQRLTFNVRKHTYSVMGDEVKASMNIVTPKVKPYLGVGFGSSIPKKRVGFEFEVGCWYHGRLKLESPNEVTYDRDAQRNKEMDDIMKDVLRVAVYPQITFRLTGRIL